MTALLIDLSAVRASREPQDIRGADAVAVAQTLEIGPQPDAGTMTSTVPRFRATLVGSVLLHGLLAAWLLLPPWSQGPGLGGDTPDAISIEVISAEALDALGAKQMPAAGQPGSAVDNLPGPDNPVEQAEIVAAPEKQPEPPPEKPVEALVKPDPSVVQEPDIAAAEIVKATPEPPVKEQRVETPQPEKPPETVDAPPDVRPPQVAIVAGATPAAPQAAPAPAEAAARQAAGDAARFALAVRQALGKSRPRHAGTKGRVVITFGLAETGGLRFAEVSRSSGNEALDAMTLAAVRIATFPRPPANLSDRQRTYVVPFDYK